MLCTELGGRGKLVYTAPAEELPRTIWRIKRSSKHEVTSRERVFQNVILFVFQV